MDLKLYSHKGGKGNKCKEFKLTLISSHSHKRSTISEKMNQQMMWAKESVNELYP